MNLAEIADNIHYENGIWVARQDSISYPEQGNQECFQLEENSFWFRHRNQCIIEAVRRFPPAGPLFDIGGGNGFVAQALEAAGFPTILVEPGIDGILNARHRAIKILVNATLESAGFKANSLTGVGLFDVLEHIREDEDFLQKIHRYLLPGGCLYLTVPAYRILWSDEDNDAGHFRRYTLSQLSDKLRKVGFSILYNTYLFSFLPLPIFLFRTLPSKLPIKRHSSDMEKHRNEHRQHSSRLLDFALEWERRNVIKCKKINFGGSCLVVAKKSS